jgi:dolichyl-phosphate-mannose--protein O-mannosyl transferase
VNLAQAAGARRDAALALGLALVAAVFRLPRLGLPAEEVFDEVYHAKTALQYLSGEAPTEWVHPPTAKLLIAVGVYMFGYHSWAWRLVPALAGVALAPVFFLLARRVLATERAALLASALLLCDGVYLVQSRIAMTNIFAVLFQVSAALLVLRAALAERLRGGAIAGAGLMLGLALSTRWTSLWAAGFLGLVLAAVRGRRLLRPRELALTALAFGVIPVLVYVLSYLPWMAQRHDPRTFLDVVRALQDMVQEQGRVWRYHAGLQATHPYFSKWYTWPWLYRPTWYYFHGEGEYVRGIVAIGNPALWWAALPVSLWAAVSGALRRDPRRLFAGVGFFALYLPWGISPRTLNYSHYLFEAIPYACLSLGMLVDRAWQGRFAWLGRGYVAAVAFLFVFFYPFLAALPVPTDWYNHSLGGVRPWTWFPTWV